VSFTLSRPIPKTAFGITLEEAKVDEAMTDGPLISGIPALGPGDARTITWGQFGGLTKALGNRPIDVDIVYPMVDDGSRGKAKLKSPHTGTDASQRPTVVISKSLKEIAGGIQRIARAVDAVLERQLKEGKPKDEDLTPPPH
jgi:hypothetical protein